MSRRRQGRAIALPPRPPRASERNPIAEYVLVLRALWTLEVDPSASPEECQRLLGQQVKLSNELGPEFAEAVMRNAVADWWREHWACPWCGEADCQTSRAGSLEPAQPPIPDVINL